jgi:hypothetical protein
MNSQVQLDAGQSVPHRPAVTPVPPTLAGSVLAGTAAAATPGEAHRPEDHTDGAVRSRQRTGEPLSPLEWFFARLEPVDWELTAVVPQGGPLPPELTAEQVRRLQYVRVSMTEKRALDSRTCAALAYRANRPENEGILQDLRQYFDWLDILDSGLWLRADSPGNRSARPNPQFCGLGLAARKARADRRSKDDKWHWGPCQPVLIPYFDSGGKLLKLRPHKGGAPAATVAGSEHIYVPRHRAGAPAALPPERFPTVIICEGEFKAAVLWQELGAGQAWVHGDSSPPIGVCALPGISFVRNLAYQAELVWWLREVQCKQVIVAFDSEDKAALPMPQRCDARKYGRYLAVELQRRHYFDARVLELPIAWRNDQGKADWDGAAARLLREHNSRSLLETKLKP